MRIVWGPIDCWPNVGGALGSKIYAYPEHALVLLAARIVGHPVRWSSSRREAYLSDTQGRGHQTEASIALDQDYRFLALSVKPTVDLGAYLSQLTPLTATAAPGCSLFQPLARILSSAPINQGFG